MHRDWKWRSTAKKGQPYYMRLWRNYLDARFCPVYWLFTYLYYFELEGATGPIFQKSDGGHFSPDTWTAATDRIFKGVRMLPLPMLCTVSLYCVSL